MEPRWVLPFERAELTPQALDKAALEVGEELKLPSVVAKVLVARGYRTAADATKFMSDALTELPDPFTMKGLPEAVERLLLAISRQEKVTLYGDYDVDGVSSTALLTTFLRQVGLEVRTYIPHRLGEGYGLNRAAIERIASEGTTLLVTLDCGITSHPEIERANELGMNVVVVDHHAVPEVMPPAVAVLNPLQPGCGYTTKWLCAGGVTFNLCMGLRKVLRERGHFAGKQEPNLKQLLDLVALATVADVVPLTGANRVLVTHGLKELTAGRRPGVRALKDVAEVGGIEITAGTVGFRLGPRINAAGRLDDASVGLQCLLAKDYESALPLARALDSANAERQQIERAMLNGAIEQATDAVGRGARGLVLSSPDWHPGVVGIVASRIVERFHRPTILIGVHDGMGKGSARSIEGFHLYDAIKSVSHHLSRFGGHKAAAGLSIEPDRLAHFTADFERVAHERLDDAALIPRQRIDAVVSAEELSEETVNALQKLAPFGMGNPEPILAMRGQQCSPRVLQNKTPGEPGHLKLTLDCAPMFDVIGFRQAEKAELTNKPIDLAFKVDVDEFRGVRRLSLKLSALRSAS
ncbi:MAG: single-stranded-DNA-specific exonuclease RecJ [Archangium gephyra]|uniref:Single-stranded-DNA-specific exonuclease RecJ n=1 Tax=Archangium gephyra TaxID=48 RepID=A0A2W5TMH7_9BACT|nr:MAG: single-stranded-DNA-specific exonuclease RecJ [Archangium gephyra]